ncbi:hypothetical protein ABQF04_11395 [Xanthomonas campestris pv. campestris]|uniref:hypothetical protein n=1 Tax=Xanthomonas campestris TaxID=339 RepID=UPI0032E393FD
MGARHDLSQNEAKVLVEHLRGLAGVQHSVPETGFEKWLQGAPETAVPQGPADASACDHAPAQACRSDILVHVIAGAGTTDTIVSNNLLPPFGSIVRKELGDVDAFVLAKRCTDIAIQKWQGMRRITLMTDPDELHSSRQMHEYAKRKSLAEIAQLLKTG